MIYLNDIQILFVFNQRRRRRLGRRVSISVATASENKCRGEGQNEYSALRVFH
jgi:hypothetical protein